MTATRSIVYDSDGNGDYIVFESSNDNITASDIVEHFQSGNTSVTYKVTYTMEDDAGNTADISYNFTVEDTSFETFQNTDTNYIKINDSQQKVYDLNIELDDVTFNYPMTYSDTNTPVTLNIVVTGGTINTDYSVDESYNITFEKAGVYTVEYEVSDNAGNIQSEVIIINVYHVLISSLYSRGVRRVC